MGRREGIVKGTHISWKKCGFVGWRMSSRPRTWNWGLLGTCWRDSKSEGTHVVVLEGGQHPQLAEDSLAAGQVLEDVGHLLQRHALVVPRVGDGPVIDGHLVYTRQHPLYRPYKPTKPLRMPRSRWACLARWRPSAVAETMGRRRYCPVLLRQPASRRLDAEGWRGWRPRGGCSTGRRSRRRRGVPSPGCSRQSAGIGGG